MRKYLYLIKKKKIKSWLKFWLLTNNTFNSILSNILEGTSFNLQNTVKRYFKIFNIFGNSTQDGTPSPENPVPIHSVADEGTVTIKQRGKNLLKNILESQTINGITITKYSDGTFLANGTANNLIAITLCDISNIKAIFNLNKKITLTGCPIGGGNNTFSLRWLEQGGTTQEDFGSGATFTPSNYSTNLYLIIRNGVQLNNALFKPMIRLSTIIDNTYEPYQANNYTFQTSPLRSLPNGVRDSLEAEKHRKIGKQTGTLTETTTITLSDAKTNGAYMCNIKPSGTLTGKTIELEAGNYEIIYELEEEIIEPYTEEQQEQYNKIKELYTFNGTTNIYSDDEVPPYLQIQYYMKGE